MIYEDLSCSKTLPIFGISDLIYISAILEGWKCYHIVVLISIYLMTNAIELFAFLF